MAVAPAEERCLAATGAEGGPWEAFACGVTPEPGRLTGWWAQPGPGVLENPYADQAVVEGLESYVWETVLRLTPRLGARLAELTGLDRGPAYWETLLQPWLVHAISAVCDRRLALLAAAKLAPGLPVEGVAPPAPPANAGDSVRLLYTDTGNRAVIPMIAERMGHQIVLAADPATAPAPHRPPAPPDRMAFVRKLPRAPRAAAEVLVRALLAVAPGRRVAAVGLTRLPPLGMLRLARRVGLRTPPRGVRLGVLPPPPAPPAADPELRARLALGPEGDELEAIVGALLPAIFPRTLLEGLPLVADRAAKLYGKPSAALAANYSTTEIENDFLGRCRESGYRVGFVQHGAVYLQARVHAQERLELRPNSMYLSWGGSGGPARPTPSAYLERIRDTYVGGEAITVIEGLEPPDPYLLRYGSYPLGNRAFATAQTLGEVVASVAPAVRDRMVLRRFPNPQARPQRPDALEALPFRARLGLAHGGGSVDWMQRSRVALIGYPGTPLLEAVTVGVPFVVLWDPDMWPVREDGLEAHYALERARMSFRDPHQAARHLDAVADDVSDWWQDPATQEARRVFGERYAIAGDWLEAWTSALRDLSAR